MIVERQTIPHLNALVGGTKILEEQICSSFRGCHATSPLKSVFFTRKVEWQLLIELHSWAWHILRPTSRAKRWGIICLCSYSGSLSNPLRSKIAEGVYEELRDRVYLDILYSLIRLKDGPLLLKPLQIFTNASLIPSCNKFELIQTFYLSWQIKGDYQKNGTTQNMH